MFPKPVSEASVRIADYTTKWIASGSPATRRVQRGKCRVECDFSGLLARGHDSFGCKRDVDFRGSHAVLALALQ